MKFSIAALLLAAGSAQAFVTPNVSEMRGDNTVMWGSKVERNPNFGKLQGYVRQLLIWALSLHVLWSFVP